MRDKPADDPRLPLPRQDKSENRLLRKIENLGFEVTGIREKQAA